MKKENTNKDVGLLISPERINLNPDQFAEGIHEVSKLAGRVAGLLAVGVPPEEALSYFITLENMEHEEKVNKETGSFTIEVAKINAESQVKSSERVEEMIASRMM